MVDDGSLNHQSNLPVGGLALTLSLDDATVVVVLDGEVDHATRDQLRNLVDGVLATGVDSLVVDCTKLMFMDSAGLSVLAELVRYTGARGGTLTIRNPGTTIRRLLEVTGFDRLVTVT